MKDILKQHLNQRSEVISDKENIKNFLLQNLRPCIDSREVDKNSVFFALQGSKVDARNYILDLIDKEQLKAVCFSDEGLNSATKEEILSKLHSKEIEYKLFDSNLLLLKLLGSYSRSFYSCPDDSSYLTAITGTNGKTSCASILMQLNGMIGYQSSSFGTLGFCQYTKSESIELGNTTSDPIKFFSLLNQFHLKNPNQQICSAVEFSSHALSQYRNEAVNWDSAIFTNLTLDHLDFHLSMEDYYLTKKRLFAEQLNQSNKKNKIAIIDTDSSWGCRLNQELSVLPQSFKLVSVSSNSNSTYQLFQVSLVKDGLSFVLKKLKTNEEYKFSAPLIGYYNVKNLSICLSLMLERGISYDILNQAVKKLEPIIGRLQKVNNTLKRFIYIDYAHTPDALENVLLTLREIFKKNKITVVFGCGGNRDKTKRAIMGEIASKYADKIVITSDNPRNEIPENIITDIESGVVEEKKKDIISIINRKEAIENAILNSKESELILIAGKGHESYQEIGQKRLKFSDYDISIGALSKLEEFI